MYSGGGAGAVSHGMWWNSNATAGVPAAACSTELAGFNNWPAGLAAGGYDVAADGGSSYPAAGGHVQPRGGERELGFDPEHSGEMPFYT